MNKFKGMGFKVNNIKTFMTSSAYYSNIKPNPDLVIMDRFKSVTILSINRPDIQNAMNENLLYQLSSQLTTFEEDTSASAAVINGIGGNFSIGYDIEELKKRIQGEDPTEVKKSLIFPFVRKTTKPILCSISGLCKSIGFEIALKCDIRYVEENAVLGFQNRQLGIPLMNNGPQRLVKLIGLSKAIDFLAMGRLIEAKQAVELGIATSMVQDGTGLGTAIKTATFLSSLPQLALQRDLFNSYGSSVNEAEIEADGWQTILNDIKSSINLSEESLKSLRISKLNNMPEWESEEIKRERNDSKMK